MKDSSELKGAADMYEKIESESSGLGKLLGKIPGFSGYIERSRRREADQMIRQHIARQLEAIRVRLAQVQENMARDILLAIEHAEPLGRIDVSLRGLAGKIHDAPSGYAGFFDAVKIDAEALAQIYQFDESILAHVDLIDVALTTLDTAVQENGEIGAAMNELQKVAREANAAYDKRQDVLSGIA